MNAEWVKFASRYQGTSPARQRELWAQLSEDQRNYVRETFGLEPPSSKAPGAPAEPLDPEWARFRLTYRRLSPDRQQLAWEGLSEAQREYCRTVLGLEPPLRKESAPSPGQIKQPQSQIKASNWKLVGVVVVILSCFSALLFFGIVAVVLESQSPNVSTTSRKVADAAPPRKAADAAPRRQAEKQRPSRTYGPPEVGSEVWLLWASDPNTNVFLAVDSAAFSALTEAVVARDDYGLQQLIRTRRVHRVNAGTLARVLDVGWTSYKVRITEGPLAGVSGWVAREAVQVPRF